MSYYFSTIVKGDFDGIIEKVAEELMNEGFGVLTDIDVRETLKKKIDVEFHKYRILGACNPSFAYRALQAEDKVGTMLPCNVIVHEIADNEIEIAAVDPMASMEAIKNPKLEEIAGDVRQKLRRVIERV